jgi:hypothetical protein
MSITALAFPREKTRREAVLPAAPPSERPAHSVANRLSHSLPSPGAESAPRAMAS